MVDEVAATRGTKAKAVENGENGIIRGGVDAGIQRRQHPRSEEVNREDRAVPHGGGRGR
jgi:hypothetical protein